MQKRRMPRNVKRASGAVVCAVALLSGCSGHPLADTAREALQAVTAGEVLPAPLARAYLLLGLSLALNAVMLLCWAGGQLARLGSVPFPVSWTVKMKKKQKETQDILSYHTQAAGCSDKARAKASGGRQPIEECGRTGL